ncbi:MAG: prepilin-type N-terminal cleavage/methylation domain-containing protein [Cardiobacteriaceae bacterium]|nr:prepilin-type N-terminal cleavage/methylation domain-containing protein [Cardiobacteriaceae bacterium]
MKSRFKTNISSHKGKYLHKNQQGMSLLEVVVAMLLCGIGLAIPVGMYQASIRHAQQAEYRAIAMREAQVLIDEMRANKLGAPGFLIVNQGAVNKVFDDEHVKNKDNLHAVFCKHKTPPEDCKDMVDDAVKKSQEYAKKWRDGLMAKIPTMTDDHLKLEWAGEHHRDRYTLTIRWKTVIDETASQGKGAAAGAGAGGAASPAPEDDAVVVQFVL